MACRPATPPRGRCRSRYSRAKGASPPDRHHGRRHKRRQVHDERIHRHHAVLMSDERHFAVEPDAPVYSRGIRIKRLHLLRESLLAAAATVDEHPVVPLAQQADRLAAQLFGIGLPRLGRKRRETDPHTPLLPIGFARSRRTAGAGSANSNPSRRNVSQ